MASSVVIARYSVTMQQPASATFGFLTFHRGLRAHRTTFIVLVREENSRFSCLSDYFSIRL